MPCNSDYLEPSQREVELSRVATLLGELDGDTSMFHQNWMGMHPLVYGKRVDGDELVSRLCSRLQNEDVTKYSLEMQMWWRDHQKADKARLEAELFRQMEDSAKQAAVAKLTPYERKLLGL